MFGLPFHHIGIACADIEDMTTFVMKAFAVSSDTGIVFDPVQNAYVRLFNMGSPGAIELVSGPGIASLLKKGVTYYHLCYSTPDLDATLSNAAAAGAMLVSGPAEAVLFGGRRVAFVMTKLGLVEFLEIGSA
jgi:methylmalonyl-CoA/ethylmalonyl-CoA epimerase